MLNPIVKPFRLSSRGLAAGALILAGLWLTPAGLGAADWQPAHAWDAQSGYGGWQLTMTLAKRFKKIWVGGFLRADHLGGASFEDSPLVRQQTSWTGGIGISWIFLESSQRVATSR